MYPKNQCYLINPNRSSPSSMDVNPIFSTLHGSEEYDIDIAESDILDPLDRLSELPDSLIFEIFSFLPMRDVVKTALLSKRWRDVWNTVQYLDFLDEYCHFICEALAQWKGAKILQLSLGFHDDDDPPTFDVVDSLLCFGVEKQVEELHVYLGPNMDREYWLPQCLYSCSSITKLSLSYCEMNIEENVQWDHLKSLTVANTDFLSEYDLSRILHGAPMLEELTLWSFDMSKKICIHSRSLKKLQIGDGGSQVLRIWAPNLLTLDISCFVYGACLFYVPSLNDAVLHFRNCGTELNKNALMFNQVFRSICHVEKATLSDWCVKSLVYMKEQDMAVFFSNAKFLNLYAAKEANEMLDVLEMFPKLMMLIVNGDNKDGYSTSNKESHIAKKRKIKTFFSPSFLQLKTVEISWSLHDASIIQAIQILLQNAHLLEKMVFRPIWFGDHQKMLSVVEEKVLSMPRSSPTADVIVMK